MADIGVPSFSLGLDLDSDSEPQPDPIEEPVCNQAPEFTINVSSQSFEEDEDFQPQILQNQNPQVEDSPPVLKRLKRGPTTQFSSVEKKRPVQLSSNAADDDDIEDFSPQKDPHKDAHSSVQNHSVCSSSKYPLHGHRVLSTQSVSQPKPHTHASASSASISTSLDASKKKLMFPKLTISPLRRFQLLDSDSDEPSPNGDPSKVDASRKEREYNPSQAVTGNQQKRAKFSANTLQTEDLWKDFSPKKTTTVPTPALDEFCKEYFTSVKNKTVRQSKEDNIHLSASKSCFQKSSVSEIVEQYGNLPNPLPPAYRYFYHDDSRIQRLVRDRLLNFSPIGAADNRGNNQSDEAVIDYMSQFGQRERSSQFHGTRSKTLEESWGRNNSKQSNSKQVSQASGSWVNPKDRNNIPKDAGKRRVSADSRSTGQWYSSQAGKMDAGKKQVHVDGRSSGHWYTGQDGKKVYVTKNGQELTGRDAYKHYKKESGARFKKSKKKATSKKKSKR